MVAKWNRSKALSKALDIEALKQPLSQELIDEYNATSSLQLPPPTPGGPRYWESHDRVFEQIESVKAEIERRNAKDFRDGWWRFNTLNKVLGPLLRVAAAREENDHFVYWTYWPDEHGMPERHCTCGLVLDAPDIFNPRLDYNTAASSNEGCWPTEEAEVDPLMRAFFDAEGHIDWRMLDPENYALDDELEDEDDE